MMGEVVEDVSAASKHQHLQKALVEEADKDDAENNEEVEAEEEARYNNRLAALSLRTGPATRSSVTAKNTSSLSTLSFVNFSREQNSRRKALLRRHRNAFRGSSVADQVKARKELQLRFLEAAYVRNVLLQSLPHSPSLAVSPASSSSHDVDASSSATAPVPRTVGRSGDSGIKSNHRNNDDGNDSSKGDGGMDSVVVVPKWTAISESKPSDGLWYNCLKSKAMNERDPEHLLKVMYSNLSNSVSVSQTKDWLSKQKKKSRTKGGGGGGEGGSDSSTEKNSSVVEVQSSSGSSSNGDPRSSLPITNNVSSKSPLPDGNGPGTAISGVDTKSGQLTTTTRLNSKIEESSDNGPTQARPRSLDKEAVQQQQQPLTPPVELKSDQNPSAVSSSPSTPSSSRSTNVETRLVGTTLTSKEGNVEGEVTSEGPFVAVGPKTRQDLANLLKFGSARGAPNSNACESNSKSVISENTDSSSSGSTNVSSNSYNNENSNSISIPRLTGSGGGGGGSGVGGTMARNSNTNSSDTNASTSSSSNHGSIKSNKKPSMGPKTPKKYSEKLRAEASVVQRITELQKEGMWWEKRLPKVYEPPKVKSHWDYLLEEMTWMAADFANERKWKRNAAKKCARMIEKYFHDKELKRQRAEKEEEARKKKTAATIAKLVRQFWSNVQTVVEFKEQTIIDSMRKKALDQKLSYLVNETEKYSEIVAQTFTAIAQKTGIEAMDKNEESKTSDISSVASASSKQIAFKEEVPSPVSMMEEDDEFVPPTDSESDVDDTIAEQEAKEKVDTSDHANEIQELEAENNMSYEELISKYSKYLHNPEAFKEPTEPEPARRVTRGRRAAVVQPVRMTRRQKAARIPESDIETDVEDDAATSSTEEESADEDDGSDAERTNDDLASLLKSISSEGDQKTHEEETNKLADLAESFKPKGNTLSSTTVVTKVPHLLRHQLREYQHIGLDWLVTMYDKKLNGILADEMGLGKTIQTIALLAYLAVERFNWGPHLIVVPTSVMLNWEMEFKKWCPGFKILTYYGSQKERKLKRSGWTKPNAFHVCITSYKLVIQDHQSFRRKRWKYLILDEAQNIKNFKSQRWQLLLNFHTQRRLLLTGTPLQNNLMELWSLLHFLMPNVFQSHMEFKDWFSNPMSGMVEGSQEYNEDIVRRLHKVLRPFILRRMKSEVEKQLPQKYEHVVMCSLSKRQRYLYEEFMSRTKTKDTLNQGNLLSVINVLMQLRKVCNHPNLFEPRPIVSPLHTEGITYSVPSCTWDMLSDVFGGSFRQHFPLFTITSRNHSYDEVEAKRIDELTPLFAYSPDEERRYVVMNYEQCTDTNEQPPAKRPRRIVNLVKNEPPPCPRLQKPLTFFMSTGKPDRALQDAEFMECLGREADRKYGSVKVAKKEGSHTKSSSSKNHTKPDTGAGIEDAEKGSADNSSESENERTSNDSDFEVVVVRRRKKAIPRFDITSRLEVMGCTVADFELDFIQERKLYDRKAVVDKLNKVNWNRCRVQSFVGPRLLETCGFIGSVPSQRLASKKTGCRGSILFRDKPRDYTNSGYFNLGIGEVMRVIRTRLKNLSSFSHPFLMWTVTKHLSSLILTAEDRMQQIMDVLKRYVMYIPAVSARPLESLVYRPVSSAAYFNRLNELDDYRKNFSKSTDIIHPIVSRMLTQFPDPRLIQYDCGKLQTLDKLLRRLKSENHRVLIFTQMAKVLDILEAFLNYHGHTYLRLDGATKIDQRQLLMERFNADKKIFCFILSTRSGGIGVNLTGADTVIFYDSDWNPTMDAQAQDRCHRIGQTRDVHIYRLVSEKTVEENILKKSNQKRLLGELAIEGGKFTTTYFKQHTIRELFTINEKDDVVKRLSSWNTDPSSSNRQDNGGDESSTLNPTDLMRSPEKKHEMQMIECALAAAEDDTDVQAAQTVHAEAEAEMAEFDESVSLDALDDQGKTGPNKFEIEFQQVFERMTDVERYAFRRMESTIDDWSKETAQAQRDLQEQKLVWELEHQKTVQDMKVEIDDDSCTTEDLLTYSNVDATSQVWVAQFGSFEQEMPFMIYEPPTPPHDEMDVYFDYAHGYLYDYSTINESLLPPVYVPKHPKKQPTPSSPVPKPGTEKLPEPPKEPVTETIDLDSDSSPNKKSPKVARREDPIFAPKSLFDRPSPAMAKLRRDLRLQRYSCRPATASPKTLGPGSITFPIVNPAAQKTPPPPTPSDSQEWMLAEDYSLLQTVRNVLELPPNLLVVNLAQTPNWDFAADAVNMVGFSYRTQKQCKWRYENVVAPREDGKLLFDPPPATDPSSPTGKKKKAKAFIKITPPSPSKAARNVKVSQLLSQDNNAQFRNTFSAKFDTIKTIANKRAPTTKPAAVNSQMKQNKHAQVFAEHGINYENPLPATVIAKARYDRIQLERKKLELARQQAAVAVAGGTVATTLAGVPATIIGAGPATAAAMAVASANTIASKPRATFTPLTISGNMAPLVLQANTSGEIINRDAQVNIPNMITPHRRPLDIAQQQQQFLLQQQQALVQQQALATQQQQQQQQQQPIQQQLATVQPPQPNVTVLTAGPVGTTQAQPIVRPATPVPVHQTAQGKTQTVVLASGLAQALSASVGPPISVSSSPVASPTVLSSAVNTSPTILPPVRHALPTPPTIPSQTPLLRPGMTMKDLRPQVSSGGIPQPVTLTTTAPTVQSVGQPQQNQPTLVSLTPVLNANAKIIGSSQGLLVHTSSRGGGPTLAPQAGTKLSPLQVQYLRQSGIIRQASPVTAPVVQPQQVHTIKDQLVGASPQQMKRIQVVTASGPPTIVSSSTISSQQAPVTLPTISAIPAASTYSTVPVVSSASTPVVTICTTGTASKVSLTQPAVTMALSAPNVSAATASAVISQQSQRQVQLVKQHTVGGKTVTRPVTDAEVAAFLKQHGIPAITNPVSAQGQLPGTATSVAAFSPVQGQPTLLTVGLQNIMKVQQAGSGPLATIVKSTPAGQGAQPTPGGTLAFPVHVSKISTKGGSPASTTVSKQQQQQLQALAGVFQRRQQQDAQPTPQQPQVQTQSAQSQLTTQAQASAAGKITHITTQVTPQGNIPTHVVVQTASNKLPNTLAVQQLQQVFKQVGATGQVIGQGGQVLQAQMLTKPITVSGSPNTITVTTTGATNSPTLTIPPSATSTPSLVHIPNIVQSAGSSPIHARIVPVLAQQPGGVKQTIQVVSGPPPPNAAIIGTGQMAVRPPPMSSSNVQTVNSIQIKIPTSTTNTSSANPNDDNNKS